MPNVNSGNYIVGIGGYIHTFGDYTLTIRCNQGTDPDLSALRRCPNDAYGTNRCGYCKSSDDPHILTFDGIQYDHHQSGCYKYVEKCDQPIPIEICGCHYPCYFNHGTNTQINCVGNFKIRFFDDNGIETDSAQVIRTNPNVDAATIGSTVFNGVTGARFVYSRSGSNHYFEIFSGNLPHPQFYGYVNYRPGYLQIWLDRNYFPFKTCGLCGKYNFDSGDDDFTGSDGIQYLHRPFPNSFIRLVIFPYLCYQQTSNEMHSNTK